MFGLVNGSGLRHVMGEEMIADFAAKLPEYKDFHGPYKELRDDGCYVGFADEGQLLVDRLV